MNILSIYPITHLGAHDTNVALLKNGKLIYSYEEQKLSRTLNKEPKFFPDRAILNCFYETKIHPSEIDYLCIVGPQKKNKYYLNSIKSIKKYFGIDCKVVFCPHHKAHSYYSISTSNFNDGIFLTLDAGGEDNLYGEFGTFNNNKIRTLDENTKPSLPTFYYHLTAMAGFSDFDEGKVMGLSSYGVFNNNLSQEFKKLFIKDKNHNLIYKFNIDRNKNNIKLDFDVYTPDKHRPHKHLKYLNRNINQKLKKITQGFLPADICRTGQKFSEELILDLLKSKIKKNKIKSKNICLSGGLFQNILINMKIKDELGLKVHIPPGPSDLTLAAGGAYYTYFKIKNSKILNERNFSPYKGPQYSFEFIKKELDKYSLNYNILKKNEIYKKASKDIMKDKVVGWFQGRAEMGNRALGSRSVLANPYNINSKKRMNQILKKRDWFMPYAPSILDIDAKKIFINYQSSPYMNLAFKVKKNEKISKKIKVAIHMDGTMRPQIVKLDNSNYAKLLRFMKNKTGIGCVLNTSFNSHGSPIVSTPQNAINLFLQNMVDVLYIENFRLENIQKLNNSSKNLESEKVLMKNMNINYLKLLKENKEINNIRKIKKNYKI